MKIKKKEKSVLDIIVANVITLIFILTFLLMVFFVYCSMTNRMPTVFGYHMLRVVTGSMDPTYPEGSYIVVKSTDTDKLKVGEVISFYSIAHLILSILLQPKFLFIFLLLVC